MLLHEGLDEAAVDEAHRGVVLGVAADVEDLALLQGVDRAQVRRDGGLADAALAEDDDVIRPTGLVNPEVEVRPTRNQVDDLMEEIVQRAARKERVLVTTLTKKMAEDLTDFLLENGLRVRYCIAKWIRSNGSPFCAIFGRAVFDVLVGINLLREGLDLPEVSLLAFWTRIKRAPAQRHGAHPNDRAGLAKRGRQGHHVRRRRHRVHGARHGRDATPPRDAGCLQSRARHRAQDDPQRDSRHPQHDRDAGAGG